jgi:hypothetical protein
MTAMWIWIRTMTQMRRPLLPNDMLSHLNVQEEQSESFQMYLPLHLSMSTLTFISLSVMLRVVLLAETGSELKMASSR